jgi:hypothetical protein
LGQEFVIKSQNLEDKINQLLPSQGGFQAGVDLSASTQIIPIVDLTETAEGSLLRQDLQNALSHTNITAFTVFNTTTTVINTTGFYRIYGNFNCLPAGVDKNGGFDINDGTTDKRIQTYSVKSNTNTSALIVPFDFTVFLGAGDSLKVVSDNASAIMSGCTRQIADINGNLVNPT